MTLRSTLNRLLLTALLAANTQLANAGCSGRFLNPVTDLCWDCMLPIYAGPVEIDVGLGGYPDDSDLASLVCACPIPSPPFIRFGAAISYWEPSRVAEVVREPYCFPSLGGETIAPGISAPYGTSARSSDKENSATFYHVHWFYYPLLSVIGSVTASMCADATENFDLAYLTELDPLWNDDETTFLLNPESILFNNPITIAACAADCIAATASTPFDWLFWCQGCQGTMYPLDGNADGIAGAVMGSVHTVQKFTFKLHRELLAWGQTGTEALCGKYPSLLMKKSAYRTQMALPIPQTSSGSCCQPYGKSTQLWGAGREYPYGGEDFAYVIWRKRACCAF